MHAYFVNEVNNKPRRKTKRYIRIQMEKPRPRNMLSESHTQKGAIRKTAKDFQFP